MIKKELKFKIYRYECPECFHSTWRDYVVESPVCSECQSTKIPTVTEDELVREIVTNESHSPEEYERAKRITQDIIEGKPLEEIEGLDLSGDNIIGFRRIIREWLATNEGAWSMRTVSEFSRGSLEAISPISQVKTSYY
jgi:hypothetical protein